MKKHNSKTNLTPAENFKTVNPKDSRYWITEHNTIVPRCFLGEGNGKGFVTPLYLGDTVLA